MGRRRLGVLLLVVLFCLIISSACFAQLSAPSLLMPANGSLVAGLPNFSWSAVSAAVNYTITVASNSSLTNVVWSQSGISGTSVSYPLGAPLADNTTYYWAVRAHDSLAAGGNLSSVFSFTKVPPPPGPPGAKAYITLSVSPGTVTISSEANASLIYNFKESWGVGANITQRDVKFNLPDGKTIPQTTATFPTSIRVSALSSVNFSDSLYLSRDTAVSAVRAGYNYLIYRQSFSGVDDKGNSLSLVIDVIVNIKNAENLNLSVSGVYLEYPPNGQSFNLGDRIQGKIKITGSGTGTIQGWWYSNGNQWRLFSAQMNNSETISLSTPADLPADIGEHKIQAIVTSPNSVSSDTVTYNIVPTILASPTLISPANGSVWIPAYPGMTSPVFSWSTVVGAAKYEIELSNYPNFTPLTFNSTTSLTSITSSKLSDNTTYYWRVRAFDLYNYPGNWSVVFSFKTPPSPEPVVHDLAVTKFVIEVYNGLNGKFIREIEVDKNNLEIALKSHYKIKVYPTIKNIGEVDESRICLNFLVNDSLWDTRYISLIRKGESVEVPNDPFSWEVKGEEAKISVKVKELAEEKITANSLLTARAKITIPYAQVSGRIKDANGYDILGAEVSYSSTDSVAGEVSGSIHSDRDGKYKLSNLPWGEYKIRVSKPGHIALSKVVEFFEEKEYKDNDFKFQ